MDNIVKYTGDEEMDKILTQVRDSAIEAVLVNLPRYILHMLGKSVEFKITVEQFIKDNPDMKARSNDLFAIVSEMEEVEHGLTHEQLLEKACAIIRRGDGKRTESASEEHADSEQGDEDPVQRPRREIAV